MSENPTVKTNPEEDLEEIVTIQWLRSIGFRMRTLGYHRKLCKNIMPGHGFRWYLCLTTHEMKAENYPHISTVWGDDQAPCFPRHRMKKREVIKLLEAFVGK